MAIVFSKSDKIKNTVFIPHILITIIHNFSLENQHEIKYFRLKTYNKKCLKK